MNRPINAAIAALAMILTIGAVAAPASNRDIAYTDGAGELQRLDLYRPDGEGPFPLVVWVHGGGWAVGDKANVADKPAHFMSHGFAFASVNYRLSPRPPTTEPDRVRHPVHAGDVAAAISYLVANSDSLDIDPERMFLMGHSAGAHIAAFVGMSDLLDQHGFDNQRLRGVVALDGQAYDIPFYFEQPRSERARLLYQNAFGTPEENRAEDSWRLASPITFADENDPPTLFILQDNPLRIEQTTRLISALSQDASETMKTVDRTHREINIDIGAREDPAGITAAIDAFIARHDALTPGDRAALAAPIEDAISRREIAGGSLLLLRHGREIYSESFGIADLESGRPFGTNEVVQIASSTKPLTAAVFSMLHVQGVLSVDDSLAEYLPEWREARLKDGTPTTSPTIRQTLSHQSGMPSPAAWGGIYRALLASKSLPTNADLSRLMVETGLAFEPGTDYLYGGVGMSVAARAAEVAWARHHGEPALWADIVRQLLLDPLQMNDTTYYPSAEVIEGMPRRYTNQDGLSPMPKRQPAPEGAMANAGGGLVSTARDLAKFYEMLRLDGMGPSGQVMSKEAINLMTTPQPGSAGFDMPYPRHGYGLGTMLGMSEDGDVLQLGHGGAFGTDAHLKPEQDLVVVFITQTPGAQIRPLQSALRSALITVFGAP